MKFVVHFCQFKTTVHDTEVVIRDKGVAKERTLAIYIQTNRDELPKLVEDFVSEGGRVINNRSGD